ncbi:MAG TPA: hypothetical protein VMY99_03315 [Nevskiaceae bacterium]|nr:hypothetical protein [Nevskiaceae bacterium]
MRHDIAQTSNGATVYVNLLQSHAGTQISQQPYLLGLVKELAQRLAPQTAEVRLDHDMGRDIGYTYVVETTEKDTILYAQRTRDDIFTRFVKNGKPLSTRYLTVILRRDADGAYELHDTWIGRLTPPRPGSTTETSSSKSYWANHAFVFDGQSLQLRTVTKVCPY